VALKPSLESLEVAALPKNLTRKKTPRIPRAVKLEQTRKALMDAATEIVGEEGYQACSVAKIAIKAKVAQGTFYTYFSSRQELFDQLLPEIGGELRSFIRGRTRGFRTMIEFEERSFDALFEFLYKVPGYHRIFSEAETLAQIGFDKHLRMGRADYVRALKRALDNGELPGYGEDELDVLAVILISLRSFIGPRFLVGKNQRRMPPAIRKTYLKFLHQGLSGPPAKRARS
jgi:AcrR family transcriptional regulator